MGMRSLNDNELKTILRTKDGLKKFLSDPSNLRRVLGIDREFEEKAKTILVRDGLKAEDAEKAVKRLASIVVTPCIDL